MSQNKENCVSKVIGLLAAIATIIATCFAAIALIPAFGQWLFPLTPISETYSTPSPPSTLVSTLTITPSATSALVLGVQTVTLSPTTIPTIGANLPENSHQISITNRLVRPVRIYINKEYINTINALDALIYEIKEFPINVRFITENSTETAESMIGNFENVYDGQTLMITNEIGDNTFFYVQISNNTSEKCEIFIDYGYEGKRYMGSLIPEADNQEGGYYLLYSNSNVTLKCDNNQFHYWGNWANETQYNTPITDLIQKDSGLLKLNYNP